MNERTHIRCYEFTKCRCSVITKLGNPGRLQGDSRSLTVPGIVVSLGLGFASFPLTPTLSPRRGGNIRPCFDNTTELGCRVKWGLQPQPANSPAPCQRSPSPRGEGWGEGEQDTRSLGRFRFGPGARKSPEGPHGFEPFIISSLRLCRRSLTSCTKCSG